MPTLNQPRCRAGIPGHAAGCRATARDRISLRAHFQPGATIVQVHGAVEADDAAPLGGYLDSVASAGRPLVVDLRGVTSFSGDGLWALLETVGNRLEARARRVLVAGAGLGRLLHAAGSGHRLPVAASVPDALRQLSAREFTRC